MILVHKMGLCTCMVRVRQPKIQSVFRVSFQNFATLDAQKAKGNAEPASTGNSYPNQSENRGNDPVDRSSANYCVNLVRKHDYENFLCTLLLPDQKKRTGTFALRALNTEIATIRDQVTQKELGMGRMYFWRDAVNQAYLLKQSKSTYVPRHPVVIEFSRAIIENDLSKKWFANLLDSRERIMTDAPFENLSELENYCDQSVTSILYLALELYGVKNVDVDHAASHLGKAVGLCNFIRSIPFNSQRRIVLVPRELLIKNNLSQENFVRNNAREQIQELTFEIASYANSHYEKAKSLRKKVPKTVLPIFLAGVSSHQYLKRLQKVQFNPYDGSLNRRDGWLPITLFLKKYTGTYL